MIYTFPTWVGNPYQYKARDEQDFKQFVLDNSGIHPCFTAHNQMEGDRILLRYLPFDFDIHEGLTLEDGRRDIIAFRDWSRSHHVPSIQVFTGGRGFHGYHKFKGQWAWNNDSLHQAYRIWQMRVIEECRFKTADKRIVGDTRRVMRIINSKHQKTGIHCVELPDKVLEGGMEEIMVWASQPRDMDLEEGKNTFLTVFKNGGLNLKDYVESYTKGPITPYQTDPSGEFVRQLIPRPCIHNDMMGNNPQHETRREAVNTLIKLGYDIQFIMDFFRGVSQQYGWSDRNNQHIMQYQITWAWRHPNYRPHGCRRLREIGICIGKKCPLFASNFPEEVDDKTN